MPPLKPHIPGSLKPEISVAPMMDWTDRHCRYFHRLISPHARLYTEMVTTGALLHGDTERHLRFDTCEHPVALQLGGSDPDALARCAQMGEMKGYDEINLNCGCPSDRVQNGKFGACLMTLPEHVADCMEAMRAAVTIPVTIKCRTGVDDHDDLDFLFRFVEKSVDKGVDTFIIHARKAWLSGLSPKQNREIPPLDYDRVRAVKDAFPSLRISLNGGLTTAEQIVQMAGVFDGFMIGREAYSNPCILDAVDRALYDISSPPLDRDRIAQKMSAYAAQQKEAFGTPVKSITRHILGLYHKQVGAKAWKRYLSQNAHKDSADHTAILEALAAVQHERTRHSHSGQSHSGS